MWQKAVCPPPHPPKPYSGPPLLSTACQRAVAHHCRTTAGLPTSICQDWARMLGLCPTALPGRQGDIGAPHSPHPTSQLPLVAGYRKQHFSDPVAPSQHILWCRCSHTRLCVHPCNPLLCVLPCVLACVCPPHARHAGAHSHSGSGGPPGSGRSGESPGCAPFGDLWPRLSPDAGAAWPGGTTVAHCYGVRGNAVSRIIITLMKN